ncbi:zinc finger ZZ-type and EF-hand domain-containing protein 1-like isoform X1 [Acipenser ruthenus]|uniref:zinc finger ZZ-type and EF-hand domain-containing protein 1-like isoform X1 n=1 Tax=Acipenser ruthenus TaxID=7906 RepID=UPI002740BA03|nr:zinc finger ZZ-type and EF-hand domain-containing protein 1-like isoform X1 [Acipenser ruthenus]
MGNADSGCVGASGDEEEMEAGTSSVSGVSPASGSPGAGSGSGGVGGRTNSSQGPGSGLPPPEALLEQVKLRDAAVRMRDSGAAVSESVLARNESALVRWLEERLSRGDETVTLEQFCEMLEGRPAARDECEEAFGQFDAEGDGVVDVENMLMALKNSNGANLQGELSHVIRQLQACSLTPGFVDIFSKSKDRLALHSTKILRFLHRNRIPSNAIPFPVLEGYNNICTMRSSVVQDFLDFLLQKENDLNIENTGELNCDPELDKVKMVTKCYSVIETSSNSADIDKMTNGETVSFWQSDGSARSHWLRLRLKPDVVLRRLMIAVAANDQSYMPQQVTVAVGRNPRSLQEIRDVHIPSNVTGFVTLLENANVSSPVVQINIKRCLSDGCDTRIHGLRTVGYQIMKNKGVSVSDASAIWYLSLLTSLVTASMESNPVLVQTVLQNTRKALQHMPPLSLTPGSTEFPKFFSPNVLEEVDAFLLRIADCCVTPEAELTLLAFALARGSVAKVITALSSITDHLDTEYKASTLLASMALVRLKLLYKYGKAIQLQLQACDVKGKEEKSGPENILVEPCTGDGFLTETGKTRASIILSTGNEMSLQVTQIRIKVRKGPIGAKCGLVFAYNDGTGKFDAEQHFKRFEKYDTWGLQEYRQFLKNSSGQSSELGEDDPVSWFELDDECNDVEIKLHQCRTTRYVMVKFLCARQDTADRLGVQQLSASGYLREVADSEDSEALILTRGDKAEGDLVSGVTLLQKTLYFIQQLAQDMALQKETMFKQRLLLDFGDLNLQLFWSFYNKLRKNLGEEAVKAQVILLQLLQNCFPVLSTSELPAKQQNSNNRGTGQTEAVQELYRHLCEVVDGPEGDSSVKKYLKKEAINTVLNGAAIFFPDRQARRDQLFAMMKNITEQDQPESVTLTFESLCNYFSDQDPSGLLLLPPKGAPAGFDISPALTVMDTLLLVATRECEMKMVDVSRGESRKVLFSLFWALQGSLLSWCYLQLKGGSPIAASLAKEILVKYVEQFLSSSHSILASLLVKHSGKEIVERLTNSVLAMATRQLVIFLLELCSLDIPHCKLLRTSASFIELFKSLGSETEDSFTKMDVENCQQSQQPVLLRTWNVESPHNYENNRHETTTFLCPGATYFEVEFDERCETEKRYDYLEFTDSRGGKIRYDMKVGTEKWPKKVTYKAGPRLQFLFHSDSSNNEWGYKFTVTAYGLPDITVSWASDLQLLVSRLMGRLASRTMALKSPYEIRCVKELPPGKTALVLNSPLWKTVFRHGMCTDVRASEAVINDKHSQTADTAKVHASPGDEIKCFLIEFAKWDPSQDASDSRTDLMKWLMQACKKQPPRNEIGGGLKVDQAVNAIFASMVYHTPALHRALMNYVSCGGQAALSEEFVQVYALAEGIRTWMLEMKQKYLVGKMNKTDKQEVDPSEVNMESLALTCIEKSLLLFKFNPSGTLRQHNSDKVKSEALGSRDERNGRAVLTRQRSVSISEGDFQASPSTSSLRAEATVKDPEARRQSQSQEPSTTSKPLTTNPSQGVASAVSLIKASSDTSLPQHGDPSSPSTPTRKAPFSRGRLRLLSFRSMEEARIVPSIKEKYPILKHINDFMKDQAICQSNVLQVLSLKKTQAQSVHEVLRTVRQCLHSLGRPHLFQAPCILFLQELLACQKDFTSYFRHLDGCGKQLRQEVRQSFYQLVLLLLNAVQSFNNLHDKTLLPALSCVQTCLLHLLDMSWEVQDLALFIDIKLPDLLLTMSQENISVHDIAISQWTEDDEIADYERNMEWMEECQDGMFERWYDKITQAAPEDKRKMHMFIARYCDLLNVEISCDGCDKIAPWHRFRCLQCMDMDLCKTCFLSGAKPEGHEDDHEMVNMEYACDHCQGLIVGSRINCNVCDDFDLCFGCYNAKKYPDSHLPTHRITVFPMVTIRISDRHRLIQPYIHNYSWLLFAALALYTSDLASEGEVEGERLDSNTLASATNLQTRCTELIADCLLKGQNGKSLRASALLSLLSPNESVSESDVCPVSSSIAESSQELSTSNSSAPPGGSSTPVNSLPLSKEDTCTVVDQAPARVLKAGSGSEGSSNDIIKQKALVPQDTLDSSKSLSQTPSVCSEEATSPTMKGSEAAAIDSSQHISLKQEDRATRVPVQEHVFAECSRERILGLLAAMLPPAKLGSTISVFNLRQTLPLLFQVVISNAGCLNETYHLTLGLLGQLLLRIAPADADSAVTEALADKYALLAQGEGTPDTQGWKTTQLLFSLGAVCLDSRIGLDWACSVADILRDLNACPQWCNVISAFTDHCVKQLPLQLKRTNLFTLLVLVGFPEVLCMGTHSVFIDNANEPHNMIILKHFTEKNRAAVVDVKTRKRRTVKDYQLVQLHGHGEPEPQSLQQAPAQSRVNHYLQNFVSITSHLLQTNLDSSSTEAVEATWVLALALKGLYNTLKKHGVEEAQAAILQSGLIKLLVRKCSKGTGFSKMWLLRDLEILSIMLYSSKKEIHSMAEGDPENEEKELEREPDSDHSSSCMDEQDQNKPDPLEGLDEETKICFQITHDALNAPLHILRAMYELQMKRTDSFFLEVQKRFDGDVITTDETIRNLAQKWQAGKCPRSEERSTKAVDTDMIVVPCESKPRRCENATEETNLLSQKLITSTESDLQLSYAKQRRTKSSALLHKELDARSNKSVRQYLFKVNEAIGILYARHVLASLLSEWPSNVAVTEDTLELSGASHMAYILDMLMQLEEKQLWEKILQKVLQGCSESMLDSLSLTACQFMEEPGMAVQVRESKHPYDNNTTFEDKVHIPSAIYLSIKFDSRSHTEEGCDELLMSSSSDFLQDHHNFSGSSQKWTDFEIPGDTLYYKFISDMSNTEWGYKFTVTGGHRGRFQTGFEILKVMLVDERAFHHLPLADIWEWQVGVACRQTGNLRLKAIHLLLRILVCSSESGCDLTLLRPLWQLFTTMESSLCQDPTSISVLLPLHRALTELFFTAESRAIQQGVLQEYLLALTTDEQLHVHTVQALKNIAAISLAINYPNKSTKLLNVSP